MLGHFMVDMVNSFVLVDLKGTADIGDIDIASIQRLLSSGHLGPPGFKVGLQRLVSPYRGRSDSAELESYFNRVFKSVGYPPGYDVFQHGGRIGTVGFFKGLPKPESKITNQEAFDFFGTRTVVG